MRMSFAALVLCLAPYLASAQEKSGIEYRIEKERGYPLDWANGETKFFSELPFMTAKDFSRAVAVRSNNLNSPGSYDVGVHHTAQGKVKFRAVADADRERTYCVIFRSVIRTCSGFAPPVKDIYDRGSTIYGLSKADADKLSAEINASLRGAR
jgi:hypothetical protein